MVLERAVNTALAAIPLAAQPQVQLIAPLGDRARLYVLITSIAVETETVAVTQVIEDARHFYP